MDEKVIKQLKSTKKEIVDEKRKDIEGERCRDKQTYKPSETNATG